MFPNQILVLRKAKISFAVGHPLSYANYLVREAQKPNTRTSETPDRCGILNFVLAGVDPPISTRRT